VDVLERIVDGDMQSAKVRNISRGNTHRVGLCDTQNQQVPMVDDAPLSSERDLEISAGQGTRAVQRKHLALGGHQGSEPLLEKTAASAGRDALDPGPCPQVV
jgi:hypothetical protein